MNKLFINVMSLFFLFLIIKPAFSNPAYQDSEATQEYQVHLARAESADNPTDVINELENTLKYFGINIDSRRPSQNILSLIVSGKITEILGWKMGELNFSLDEKRSALQILKTCSESMKHLVKKLGKDIKYEFSQTPEGKAQCEAAGAFF